MIGHILAIQNYVIRYLDGFCIKRAHYIERAIQKATTLLLFTNEFVLCGMCLLPNLTVSTSGFKIKFIQR